MPEKPPRAGRPPGWLPRGLAPALGLAAAVFLMAKGGALVNRANPMGGPMNLDVSNPLGALCLGGGAVLLTLLPPAWWRAGWALAGLAAAVPAAWNFWQFPPFPDGAWYSGWRGEPDPAEWPPGPSWTMLGLSPLAFALAAAGADPPGRRWRALGAALLATVAACWAYDIFTGAWYAGAPGARRLLVMVPCAALAALAVRYQRHFPARVAGAYALVVLVLCFASIWLERIPPLHQAALLLP